MKPRAMPAMSRLNYRREFWATFFFSAVLAAIDGMVMGVIVKQSFDGVVPEGRLNYMVALIAAAPEIANITSFFWAALAHARNKVRFVNTLQVVTVAIALAIAFIPRTEMGLYALAALVFASRISMSGVLTLRATLWRANYARSERAMVTGRLSTVQVLVVAGVAFALGKSLDASAESFRVFLPVVCGIGLVGVFAYGRVRMRRQRAFLRAERDGHERDRPRLNPASVIQVLKADRRYASFQLSMFLLGAGNLMLAAPLVITLRDEFGLGYRDSMLITVVTPLLVMPLAIPLWARLLDRVHVVRFRSVHSWVFVVGQLLILIAAATHTAWLLYVGMAIQGVGYAGGSLAWNLGHLDFAPAHKASQYMGVHVTLNGIRGLLAGVLAVGVYEGLEGYADGAGIWVFALSVLLCAAGGVGFMRLAKKMGEAANRPPRESA